MLPTQQPDIQSASQYIPLDSEWPTLRSLRVTTRADDKGPFGLGRPSFALFLKYLKSNILVSYTRFFMCVTLVRVASQKFPYL